MKRACSGSTVLRLLLFVSSLMAAQAQTTFIWTGIGNGWQNQNAPTGVGTENLLLGKSINQDITLPPGSFSINSVILTDGDGFTINAPAPLTLTLNTGLFSTSTNFNRLELGSNINVNVSGSRIFDAGINAIIVSGHVIGSGATLALLGTSGSFTFNDTGTGNTYTGSTVVGSAAGAPAIITWNSSPFGTGSVSFYNGGSIIAHGTQTIANAITFNTVASGNAATFRSYTAPLTFSGAITLANNTIFSAQTAPTTTDFADKTGTLAIPGPLSRQPIIFTGNIGETGGARTLTVGGSGIVILQPASGSNTYTGGTTVNGTLVFGNNNAIPTGVGNVLVGNSGYVGLGDTSSGNFAAQIGHISLTSSGALGVDTLPGGPTITYADNIDLTRFISSPNMRIGTATSAILSGTITPQGNDYRFGNGGGTLFVQSSLGDIAPGSQVVMDNNSSVPLKFFLQGYPYYTGDTVANNGFIIFDGSFLPSPGKLVAGGSSLSTGASYIGFTNHVDTSVSSFLSSFDTTNTWGIVGFDTRPGDSTASFSGIDLTGFNNGVFIGTATSAIIDNSGPIIPTADNILRLTAGNGGTLTVSSDITGGTAVVLGSPSATAAYSDGTVVLDGSNTYTGGTTINASSNGLTVALGNSAALGNSTGTITLASLGGGSVGLEAAAPGIDLANAINFANTTSLHLLGNTSFTLSGAISGTGTIELQRDLTGTAGSATLAGNNQNFYGTIGIQHSTLTLANNQAAGHAQVSFFDSTSTVIFAGAATAPVLYGIKGAGGSLVVPNGTTLTFDTSDDLLDHEFGGVISEAVGAPTSAALVVTGSNVGGSDLLYLYGNNQYTGGTTITGNGGLALGNNNAAGSGTVTLNTTVTGGLVLNTGVTFTNNLIYTSGGLAGFGTFAPANLSTITFGSGQFVLPGLPDHNAFPAGKLTLARDVVFANGGGYQWSLQDAASGEGFSQLLISGNLDLTTLSTSGFLLDVITYDALGNKGFASLSIGTPYTFAILQTGGTIAGFNAANFMIDASLFQNGAFASTVFSLTADSQHLYLSFTPVPEPSTWALLAIGVSVLGYTALRRRRVV